MLLVTSICCSFIYAGHRSRLVVDLGCSFICWHLDSCIMQSAAVLAATFIFIPNARGRLCCRFCGDVLIFLAC